MSQLRALAIGFGRAISTDVLMTFYVGDVSPRKKLFEKQAKGRKRMKAMGWAEVLQEAFMGVLKMNQ